MYKRQDFEYPDDCLVDFDLRLIDLFHEMAKKRAKKEDRVRGEYFRIKEMLGGRVPALSLIHISAPAGLPASEICSAHKISPVTGTCLPIIASVSYTHLDPED